MVKLKHSDGRTLEFKSLNESLRALTGYVGTGKNSEGCIKDLKNAGWEVIERTASTRSVRTAEERKRDTFMQLVSYFQTVDAEKIAALEKQRSQLMLSLEMADLKKVIAINQEIEELKNPRIDAAFIKNELIKLADQYLIEEEEAE